MDEQRSNDADDALRRLKMRKTLSEVWLKGHVLISSILKIEIQIVYIYGVRQNVLIYVRIVQRLNQAN